MKYRAKPVVVDAFEIVSVGPAFPCDTVQRDGQVDKEGSRHLALKNGQNVIATAEMLARMTPVPGDYWVIQAGGYTYLNPKDVFEGKYEPIYDRENPPWDTFKRPTCKGSHALGNNCGHCEKCDWERNRLLTASHH